MIEIYTNSADRKVYLEAPAVPLDNTINVTLLKDDVLAYTFNTVTAETDGRYSIVVPLAFAMEDSELVVEWVFDYVEDGENYQYRVESYVNVVTPYVSIREISEMVEDEDDFTMDDIVRIERATRHIINAHTGQSFGKHTATYEIQGTGKNAIELPARLLSVSAFNGVENAGNYFQVTGDGWWLKYVRRDVPPVRADYYELHRHHGGVIHNPLGISLDMFFADEVYTISGKWGWKSIPREITEAARLLINDYATGDTVYRDRYLTSMTAADWRIQFHSGAFRQTGNVRADQLLADFVLTRGWAVL